MYGALLKVCTALPETALWLRTTLAARAPKKIAKDGVLATKVRKGHEFDAPKLLGYLRSELGAGVLPADDGKIEIKQFSWGTHTELKLHCLVSVLTNPGSGTASRVHRPVEPHLCPALGS